MTDLWFRKRTNKPSALADVGTSSDRDRSAEGLGFQNEMFWCILVYYLLKCVSLGQKFFLGGGSDLLDPPPLIRTVNIYNTVLSLN